MTEACRICGGEIPEHRQTLCGDPLCRAEARRRDAHASHLAHKLDWQNDKGEVITPERTCRVCGRPLPLRNRVICGDPECVRQRVNAKMTEWYWRKKGTTPPERPTHCAICGKPLDNSYGLPIKYCGPRCQRLGAAKRAREWGYQHYERVREQQRARYQARKQEAR